MTPVDIPHSGISAARNAGLDAGKGDWVIFCDFDDSFSSVTSLWKYFQKMETTEYELIIGQFDEEDCYDVNQTKYHLHDGKDFIWIHGIMFRRAWLEKENLRFDPELIYHEDTYVMMIASMILRPDQVCIIPEVLYLWQWNTKSTVRSMEDYPYETYDHYLKKSAAIIRELERRDMMLYAALLNCQVICDTYINLQKISWQKYDTKWIYTEIRKFVRLFPELLEMTHDVDYVECMNSARQKVFEQNDLGIEKPSFAEWFDEIRSDELDTDVSGGDELVPGGADAAGGGGAGLAETPE